MTKETDVPREENQGHARFYLIFDEIAKMGAEESILAQEIEEIELVSRMSDDVFEDEQPRFMTST
jgi:hypothetical protein